MKEKRDWRAILLAAREEGIHQGEVARRQKVSAVCVHRNVKKLGIELKHHHGGEPQAVADWKGVLEAAQRAGKTVGDVARENSVSKTSVTNHTKRLRIRLAGQFDCTFAERAA